MKTAENRYILSLTLFIAAHLLSGEIQSLIMRAFGSPERVQQDIGNRFRYLTDSQERRKVLGRAAFFER
jgi:hypothetical protein